MNGVTEDDLSKHYITGVRRLLWRLKAWRYRRRQTRLANRFPVIGPRLLTQLRDVLPSIDGEVEYRPCRVQLAESGEWRDRVYLVEAHSYVRLWGLDHGGGREYVPIRSVLRIENSPTRLSPALANKLYAAGESGMGYCVFTLVARNGQRIPCLTGGAVDWVQLPDGLVPGDVVDVIPHEGRDEPTHAGTAPYAWSLYRLGR